MRFELVVAVLAITGAAGVAVAEPISAPLQAVGLEADTLLAHELDVESIASDTVSADPVDAARTTEAVVDLALAPTRGLADVDVPIATRAPLDLDALLLPLLPDGGIPLDAVPTGSAASASVAQAPAPAAVASLAPSHGSSTPAGGIPLRILEERFDITPAAGTVPPRATEAETPVSTHSTGAQAVAGPRVEPWVVGGSVAAGLLGLLGLSLYSRIRPAATLENETRKLIFQAVCDHPGLGVHTIAKMSGVSYSTATYHLERLVAAGMIVMTPDGNKLCYYKNGGAFTESERRILPLVKNDEAAKLLEAILDTPGTYRAALAERLGVTATTINWHLRRLRDAGLVDETRQGRNAYLFIRADAMRHHFHSLADKLGPDELDTVARLRRLAALGPAHTGGPGAA